MMNDSYQEILDLVATPSQYLGTEINSVKKDLDKVKLKMVLAFPDLYVIGMSHFGIQILYSILNASSDIAAERVFCPSDDMRRLLLKKQAPLMSLESRTPVANFDIVGFSLLYELNYTNILTMLRLSNIPFLAEQRDESHPIIIAGGPCACNPEPVAKFFDAVVFGDGEQVCMEMARKWIACKEQGTGTKHEIFNEWKKVEGVYIPSFFSEKSTQIGNVETVLAQPIMESYDHVGRAVIKDLNHAFFPEKPVVPFAKPVHDRLRIEIARGCSRGCRFCQAGMIYRPVRERDAEVVLNLAKNCLRTTGYEDISLLSLSTGDYSRIEKVLADLMKKYGPENIAVSLPSLRAGTLTRNLMESIKKVRKTGFTIAPEAGSQRLRNVINKNITENQIFETIQEAARAGWKVIKLYFMIGLPTETEDDIADSVMLIKNARNLKGPDGKKIKVNASFTTFIPKSHTPFQWSGQAALKYSRRIIDYLRDQLKGKGVQVKWQNPETSRIEGLFARGDRSLSELLIRAWQNDCRLDGWSDYFRYDRWIKSAEEIGIDVDFFTTRQRSREELLPWDHLHSGIDKEFLWKEWEKALEMQPTEDCRFGNCQNCGVCDFSNIEPMLAGDQTVISGEDEHVDDSKQAEVQKIRVIYCKTGKAKNFGHLEMVNIFIRAMRRARIPIVFSGGFHPMPKVSFENPLPLGMESLKEQFFVAVKKSYDPADMAKKLNELLPEGLIVTESEVVFSGEKFETSPKIHYSVEWGSGIFSEKKLRDYQLTSEFWISKTNKKGKAKRIDLKKIIDKILIFNKNRVLLKVANAPGKNVRPSLILKAIFELSDETIKQMRVLKLDPGKDVDVQTTHH